MVTVIIIYTVHSTHYSIHIDKNQQLKIIESQSLPGVSCFMHIFVYIWHPMDAIVRMFRLSDCEINNYDVESMMSKFHSINSLFILMLRSVTFSVYTYLHFDGTSKHE